MSHGQVKDKCPSCSLDKGGTERHRRGAGSIQPNAAEKVPKAERMNCPLISARPEDSSPPVSPGDYVG